MAPDRRIRMASAGPILDRVRMGGKKTAVAGALMLVMLFMWVRVFIGHRPAAATAAPPTQQTEPVSRKTSVKVKVVELPKVPGRHDAIERDFFTIKDRTDFRRNTAGRNTGTDKEVPVTTGSDAQEVIQRIRRMLKLEAVLRSECPRAYINDQLVSVGGKLTVKDGAEAFEFEVLQIHVDSVLVRCEGIQLTLELAQSLEVVN